MIFIHLLFIDDDGNPVASDEMYVQRCPNDGESVKYKGDIYRVSSVMTIFQDASEPFYRVMLRPI